MHVSDPIMTIPHCIDLRQNKEEKYHACPANERARIAFVDVASKLTHELRS